MMLRALGMALLRLCVLTLLAGLLGATLMRFAPGFGADARQLDPGLSSESIRAIRESRRADADVPRYYAKFVRSLVQGDLGVSDTFNAPVLQLLRDGLPLTLKNLAIALTLAWSLAISLAVTAMLARSRWSGMAADLLSSTFIAMPAAVLGLLFVMMAWPPFLAIALLVFPKIYRYSRNLLEQSYELPHVLSARARGAGAVRVLVRHVAPVAVPQWIALVGISASMALGVVLPVEVICDINGIGRLAWQAALGRDLPLLVNVTLVVTFLTVFATTVSDLGRKTLSRSAA